MEDATLRAPNNPCNIPDDHGLATYQIHRAIVRKAGRRKKLLRVQADGYEIPSRNGGGNSGREQLKGANPFQLKFILLPSNFVKFAGS